MVHCGGEKGGEETSAVRVVRRPLEKLQDDLIKEWEDDLSENKPKTPPQLLVDNFSFEELHSVMKQNGGQVLGIFVTVDPWKVFGRALYNHHTMLS